MEIDINQKKIAIGDKYKIFIDGQPTHTASTELFRLFAVVNLFNITGNRHRLTINKRHAWFKAKYDIRRHDNNVLVFQTKSFWKKHFQCRYDSGLYDIYGHRGRKYSVFKNDEQVAWWNKQKVTWFEGDNYKIIAENNSDYELIIAFCLIIDNYSSNDKGNNTITIDFGHIGPQARPFDSTWQPKY
ncbi:MAG TPA: hypothetical protein VK369_09685 [Segetibacter sp.]|nr:hypothetical protein [Segetibacter sp.]